MAGGGGGVLGGGVGAGFEKISSNVAVFCYGLQKNINFSRVQFEYKP